MAAPAYRVISKEVENQIFKHNWIFRHTCVYKQSTLTNEIITFLCKGRRTLFYGGGGGGGGDWVKMSATMVGRGWKVLKKHWLKRPKAVSKKAKFGPNTYLGIQIFHIRPHVPVDNIRVIFNFTFSNRKSQSQQKLAKRITHFTIQFCSKNLPHFTNLN